VYYYQLPIEVRSILLTCLVVESTIRLSRRRTKQQYSVAMLVAAFGYSSKVCSLEEYFAPPIPYQLLLIILLVVGEEARQQQQQEA
jgi:hypothetical protein